MCLLVEFKVFILNKVISSNLSVLLEESLDCFHMEAILLIRVDLEGWGQDVLITETNLVGVLLVLLISVCESG